MKKFFHIKSITDLHHAFGLKPPAHPLLSVVDFSQVQYRTELFWDKTVINDFYLISLKHSPSKKLIYGRKPYDFGSGSMIFMGPSQVFQVDGNAEDEDLGWGLYVHPDLMLGTSLFEKMDQYTFFHYSSHEALHLSEKEMGIIAQILDNIKGEYHNNLDEHSRNLMVSNIELLLNYCQRFYGRQFLTRKHENKDVVLQFEQLLKAYFAEGLQHETGLIHVDYFAEALNLSKSYLSDLIKKETGKTIKESVHLYMIDLAKNTLLSTNKSVSEVAYELGFEYPQYFSRIFKAKVGMSPGEFRNLN